MKKKQTKELSAEKKELDDALMRVSFKLLSKSVADKDKTKMAIGAGLLLMVDADNFNDRLMEFIGGIVAKRAGKDIE